MCLEQPQGAQLTAASELSIMMMMNDSITITQQSRRGYGSVDCRRTALESTHAQTLEAVVIETGVGFPTGV